MKKILITNVSYGPIYGDIFVSQHLKSMLDPSNIPALKDRVEYILFTDKETMPHITNHPNYKKLKELIPVEIGELGWPEQPVNKFEMRYQVLMGTFKESVKKAIEKNAYLSALTSDLIVARDFLPKVVSRLDSGEHDSVFMQPPRSAADVMFGELDKYPRAMHAEDLWTLCYQNMHPLWTACHWDAAQFTKLPFSLIWNSGQGLLVRSFSITPVIFEPRQEMIEANGVIDRVVPKYCQKPFWATDWVDAPILGVEPLFCYYPPFANHTASLEWLKNWTKQMLDPSQLEHAKWNLYYPSKELAKIGADMEEASSKVIENLI